MKLHDVRRLAIKQRIRVRFGLSNGMECVINEHGIGRVPLLNSPPDFNIEQELAGIERFSVEPAGTAGTRSGAAKPRSLTRAELQAMADSSDAPGPAQAGHDE